MHEKTKLISIRLEITERDLPDNKVEMSSKTIAVLLCEDCGATIEKPFWDYLPHPKHNFLLTKLGRHG